MIALSVGASAAACVPELQKVAKEETLALVNHPWSGFYITTRQDGCYIAVKCVGVLRVHLAIPVYSKVNIWNFFKELFYLRYLSSTVFFFFLFNLCVFSCVFFCEIFLHERFITTNTQATLLYLLLILLFCCYYEQILFPFEPQFIQSSKFCVNWTNN